MYWAVFQASKFPVLSLATTPTPPRAPSNHPSALPVKEATLRSNSASGAQGANPIWNFCSLGHRGPSRRASDSKRHLKIVVFFWISGPALIPDSGSEGPVTRGTRLCGLLHAFCRNFSPQHKCNPAGNYPARVNKSIKNTQTGM